MNKQEFIEQLRRNLSSINDYVFVNDTIAYYENYIESEVRMGKTEDEVMQQLGDPRLIAKSIKATRMDGDESSNDSVAGEYHENGFFGRGAHSVINLNGRRINLPSWLFKILTILIVFVVLFLVFTILRWLAPFIFIGILAYMIYRMITGNRRW